MMTWEDGLRRAIAEGDEVGSEEIAIRALESGAEPRDVLERGAVAGIREAGRLWKEGEYFLPDIILAAEAFNQVMKRVEHLLQKEGTAKGRVLIGSVEGDAHDLGKNIVAAMLRASLYEVTDLGVNVPAVNFVKAAEEKNPGIIGLGAYMTTTMRVMPDVLKALEEAGLRDNVKVIVGGAAVTHGYATQIGADGYAADAVEAVELVNRLLGVS
jgi:methylmalonyl-CoA mutase cobalamin-binding domain/chain